MSNLCNLTQNDYLRALLQLLPRGYAWQWGDTSAGRHVLAVIGNELHRYHALLCDAVNYSINRFSAGNQGWSAPDYERLLLTKFGIVAEVSDGLESFNCESSCESPLLDERIVYVYVITVDNISDVTPAMRDYLRQYQQSHTHFHIRDRNVTAVTDYDYPTFDCESPCTDSLYDRAWHAMTYRCDWSWGFDQIKNLVGWDAIATQIRDYTTLRRDDASYRLH